MCVGKMVVQNVQDRRCLSQQRKGMNEKERKVKMRTEQEYSKIADDFMRSVADYVEATQGSVPAEYQISFMMLKNNLMYYLKSVDACDEKGIVFEAGSGRQYISQSWNVMKESERAINETLKQFGLTTLSRSRIKLTDTGLDAESFLNSIFNNDN
jgi:hypothetical protein